MSQQQHLETFMVCKDHSVSGEEFTLLYDSANDMLITTPKPATNDLAKYYESEDYISHTDAKRGLFEKLYHVIKKYALRKKVGLIKELDPNGISVLDIGAGTGDFLLEAQKRSFEVCGTEPNEQARTLAEKKGIALQPATKNLNNKSFDVITMWHVLEHVSDLKEQLKELKRLIRPGGHIVIAVPNFKSYDAAFYKEYWAAYDVPRHLWHFSAKSIQNLFLANKMRLVNIIPMKFDAFYVALLSEKYKHGRMNYFRAFWIGMLSNYKARSTKEYSSHIYVLKNE